VKRSDCLEQLALLVNPDMLTVTSLSTNTPVWSQLTTAGANFLGVNMGLCVPFAAGLSVAFPRRTVLAIDSDGSLMVDPGALITVADAKPANLVILVFDNQAYARMGPTATSRVADLEKIAQGSGIRKTRTIRSLEEFGPAVTEALDGAGPTFLVAKVEAETARVYGDPRRTYGRAMREVFVDSVLRFPDHWGKRQGSPAAPS